MTHTDRLCVVDICVRLMYNSGIINRMASAYAVLSVKNAYRKVWNLMQNKILFTAPGEFDKWEQQCQPIGNG